MLDYSQIEAFAVLIKQRNFTSAAQQLAISQPALSQKIKGLEESFGQPLIIRSNPLQPTKLGEEILAHFHKVAILENTLKKSTHSENKDSDFCTLPIALNTETLSTWFSRSVQATLLKSKILLQIQIDDQDRTHELLKSGKVLGCISSNKTAPNGCKSYFLGKMQYILAGTREFKNIYFANGINKASLQNAPAAIFGPHDSIHDEYLANHFPAFQNQKPPYFYIPSPEGLIDFCTQNLCYALLPKSAITHLLASKKLVDLNPGKEYSVYLYWHVWSHENEQLANLTNAILKGFPNE